MITEKQQADWLALVDYLRPQGNGACLKLLEDGPDNITDFAGLLKTFKERDADNEGLNAEDYDASRWSGRIAKLETPHSPQDEAKFDLALTVCTMRYVSDILACFFGAGGQL